MTRMLLITAGCLLSLASANAQQLERRWTIQLAEFFKDGEAPMVVYGRERNGEWVTVVGSSRKGNSNTKTYNRSFYYGDLSAVPIKDGKMKGRMVMHMTPDEKIPFDHKSYTIEIDVDAAVVKDKMEGTYKVAAVNTNDKSAEIFKGKSGALVGASKKGGTAKLPAQLTLQLKLQGALVGWPPSVGDRCLTVNLGYDGGKIVSAWAVQGQLPEMQSIHGNQAFVCQPEAVSLTSDGFKGRLVIPGTTLEGAPVTYIVDIAGRIFDNTVVGLYKSAAEFKGKPLVNVSGSFDGAWSPGSVPASTGYPPGVKDSTGSKPLPPAEALARIKVPEGFRVTLFAAEPDVAQPVSLAFDDRGRLWVAECYSYPGPGGPWRSPNRDRILIFEDTAGKGQFDRRKVFTDNVRNVTSILPGFGGVYVCSTPKLIFIPDPKGMDAPAGEPVVLLDGWNDGGIGHCLVNGLTWGPDGWLYGCHGIQGESRVGKPGTPDKERVRFNGGIWRYHPTRHIFEVVCEGFTNPWGLDFDDHGQAFFTNCVIAHLWHMIPGGHYKRMYGQDFTPNTYGLLDTCADHLHWAGGSWESSRSGKAHSEAGGGHAHAGCMVYLGDNWPTEYRGNIFMNNIHGHRINQDVPVRRGSGYLAHHGADVLVSTDEWHRGISLAYGPDGGVFLNDWCENGECHAGNHRTSGRIYKIVYGKAQPVQELDLARKSDAELIQLQLHRNDWYVRHARRLLQERAAAGKDMAAVHKALHKMFADNPDVTRKLRALWTLHVTYALNEETLLTLLGHSNEHIRTWSIRFLCEDRKPSEAVVRRLAGLAKEDSSPLVRLFIASMLQRIPVDQRWDTLVALAGHGEDAADQNLPLMIWYAAEPVIRKSNPKAAALLQKARLPLLRQFIVRSMGGLNEVIPFLARSEDPQVQLDILKGMNDSLASSGSQKAPGGWAVAAARLGMSNVPEVRGYVLRLSVIFGDPRARVELRKLLADTGADIEARKLALQTLVTVRDSDSYLIVASLLKETDLASPAARGLGAFDDPRTAGLLLDTYPKLDKASRQDALLTLASRIPSAQKLLEAIKSERVPRSDLNALIVQQLLGLKNKEIDQWIRDVWGVVRSTPEEKRREMDRYKQLLSEAPRPPDLSKGRALYAKTCMQCHTLYGEGGKVGPDITGSDRKNVDYLLSRLVDPSAVVRKEYLLHTMQLRSGRVLAGIVVSKDDREITFQTANERLVISKKEIEELTVSNQSMMPEGLLRNLNADEVRDLVAYLRHSKQVPMPK